MNHSQPHLYPHAATGAQSSIVHSVYYSAFLRCKRIRDRAWIPDLSGPNVEQASLAVATRSALGRGRWMTPRASR